MGTPANPLQSNMEVGNNILAESSEGEDDKGEGQSERGKRLFTLWEIVNHYCASNISFLLEQTALMRRTLTEMKDKMGGGAEPEPRFIEGFRALTRNALDFYFSAHFGTAISQILRIHIPKPGDKEKLDLSTVLAGLSTIHASIYEEMNRRHFLFVAEDRVGYLEPLPQVAPFDSQFNLGYQEHTFWGNGGKCKIRAAVPDIQYAGNCLAAECHTAAVFHATRVAEHGIRLLAKRLNVSLTHKGKPQPIEFATWDKVISAIKNRLTAISQLPQNSKRQEKLAHYSDLADRCLYMKDLWRNDLMHTRANFNRLEAAGILQRVREFIQAVEKK